MFYSVRSEQLLMEEMDYNILFCWFAALNLDDLVWDATVFTKNRNRLREVEYPSNFWREWSSRRGRKAGHRTNTSR
jgi:IS5 family transposase